MTEVGFNAIWRQVSLIRTSELSKISIKHDINIHETTDLENQWLKMLKLSELLYTKCLKTYSCKDQHTVKFSWIRIETWKWLAPGNFKKMQSWKLKLSKDRLYIRIDIFEKSVNELQGIPSFLTQENFILIVE